MDSNQATLRQYELLARLGELLVKLQHELYKHPPPATDTLALIRQVQFDLHKLYSDFKVLHLRRFFLAEGETEPKVSVPMITIQAYLLGRLLYQDDDCCFLSMALRVMAHSCSSTIPICLRLIKNMVKAKLLKLVDGTNINPHIKLNENFIRAYYGIHPISLQDPIVIIRTINATFFQSFGRQYPTEDPRFIFIGSRK